MYDPKVGRWTSQDPEGFLAGDADLYRYVGNSPTNATDPSGLEEIPKYTDAPIGGWREVPGKKGQKPGVQGTFSWKMEVHPDRDYVIRAEFWFEPGKDNPSKQIGFLQVIHQYTVGNKPFFAVPPRFENQMKAFCTKPELANRPDITYVDNWLYYGVEWNDTKRTFVAPPGFALGAGKPKPVTAYTVDIPGSRRIARTGMGDVVARFETAVITFDSHEVLGVLKWGFKIPDKPGSRIEILNGTPSDFSLEVSGDFKKLIEKGNTVKAITHKVGKPDTSSIRVGGTSALP
jgi:hypothetical protein